MSKWIRALNIKTVKLDVMQIIYPPLKIITHKYQSRLRECGAKQRRMVNAIKKTSTAPKSSGPRAQDPEHRTRAQDPEHRPRAHDPSTGPEQCYVMLCHRSHLRPNNCATCHTLMDRIMNSNYTSSFTD